MVAFKLLSDPDPHVLIIVGPVEAHIVDIANESDIVWYGDLRGSPVHPLCHLTLFSSSQQLVNEGDLPGVTAITQETVEHKTNMSHKQ